MLPLFVLAHFGHHLLTALPIPLSPMIRTAFDLDYTQAGLVISAFNMAYGIGQLPAGWLTDRIGPRIVVTVGIVGVALAGIAVGLSTTYLMLLIFMALMGLLGGGYHPAAPPIISASVEPKKRGQALGFHMIGGSSSYFIAPIIAVAIATVWGWRGSFIGLAIPSILFGIAFYILLGRLTASKKTQPGASAAREETPSTPGRWRRLTFFIILSTFTQAVIISVISFIPLYLVDHSGASKETAALFISLYYSTGIWVGPIGGHLSDRVGRIPLILTICFLAGPAIFVLNVVPYGFFTGVLLVILGMIIYIRMPVSEAYIVGQTSAHNRSTILGIYYFGSNEAGGVFTPLMGLLIDHFGFHTGFSIAAVTALAMTTFCSFWLRGSRD